MDLQKVALNTYEFKFGEDTTKEDLEKMVKAFQEFDDRKEKINLLGIFESFPSLDSMLSISEMFKLKLSGFRTINKYAIVADESWLKNLVPITNFLTPSFPVQSFSVVNKDKALDWLKQEEEVVEYKPEEYLTGVEINKLNSNSYSMKLNNDVIDHAAFSAINVILEGLNERDKINLMVCFNNIPSFENFKTFVAGLKVDLKIFGRLNKYAIVSDSKWIETYSKIGGFLTPGIDVKAFSIENIDKAVEWIVI